MVRFKNRWLLVEFIFPASQAVPAALDLPPTASSSSSAPTDLPSASQGKSKGKRKATGVGGSKRRKKDPSRASTTDSTSEDDTEDDADDALDDPPPFVHPSHPLLLPPPPTGAGNRTLGEKMIHAALKASVLQAFGDDGWGKVSSNTNVKYYSNQTQTAIIRTSRDHYRIVQAALAFLGPVNGERVIANVLHVSGTIKKIQLRHITYNRLLVATILASLALPPADADRPLVLPSPLAEGETRGASESKEERERRWKAWEEKEQGVIGALVD